MQPLINVYDSKKFEQHFKQTPLFCQLSNDFDLVQFSWHFVATDELIGPCRQWYGDRTRKTLFSAVPFYYLDYLTEQYHGEIYDIGCGWNIFKKYYPNIVGVDIVEGQTSWKPDINCLFDKDFQKKYHASLNRIMSINAIHFIPFCHLRQRVIDFFSLLAPNGRGYLALNLMRMIEPDPNLCRKSQQELETMVRSELLGIGYEYLVFDIDLSVRDSYMDGNIRLVVHN